MDYDFVTDRLACGAGLFSDTDVRALRKVSVNAVIDCRIEYNDGPLFAKYPEIDYLWAGIPDWHILEGQPRTPIPAEWFQKVWRWALPLLASRGNIMYCHCLNGIYRGPTCAYTILRAWGIRPEWAEQMIHIARPKTIIGINGAADAEAALAQLL